MLKGIGRCVWQSVFCRNGHSTISSHTWKRLGNELTMNGRQKWLCVTSKAKGDEASTWLFIWGGCQAARKPKSPTCLRPDAGCRLGSKGKRPEKKSQSQAALSFALEVARVISVPCLKSWPTQSVSMTNGCFILRSFRVIYSAIVTGTASKYPIRETWPWGRNKTSLYPRHSHKAYWKLLFSSLLNTRNFYSLPRLQLTWTLNVYV